MGTESFFSVEVSFFVRSYVYGRKSRREEEEEWGQQAVSLVWPGCFLDRWMAMALTERERKKRALESYFSPPPPPSTMAGWVQHNWREWVGGREGRD